MAFERRSASGSPRAPHLDQEVGKERIHRIRIETNFNISEAAHRLGTHRRTLARKLEKQRVK